MEELKSVIKRLKEVSEDQSVPRNIQDDCKQCIQILEKEEEDISVKVNSCTSILDEVSNDANIPMYTRTQIWNIVSMLESVETEAKE